MNRTFFHKIIRTLVALAFLTPALALYAAPRVDITKAPPEHKQRTPEELDQELRKWEEEHKKRLEEKEKALEEEEKNLKQHQEEKKTTGRKTAQTKRSFALPT